MYTRIFTIDFLGSEDTYKKMLLYIFAELSREESRPPHSS